MDDVLNHVRKMSVEVLRQKLDDYGINVGPITQTTRSIFDKRLAKLIFQSTCSGEERKKEETLSEDENKTVAEETAIKVENTSHKPNQSSDPDFPIRAYYGVCLPAEIDVASGRNLVFTDKAEALLMAKKFSGARFKVFKTQKDAEEFSKLPADAVFPSPIKTPQNNGDKQASAMSPESSPYRAPKVQEILQLKKLIESGDCRLFKEYINSNPRYLVSSGDTPVIFQEGSRYTAMHLAAMKNQPEMCQLILDTLEDRQFVRKLYVGSKDTEETMTKRINFLVDLYLNMPDKGNCETPLHFACKFGHIQVVEVLISHPKTDKKARNKYGETPFEVICARCQSTSKETKELIAELLKGQIYVPLIRSEDNTAPPMIGQPWSPNGTESHMEIPNSSWSPKDPPLSVKACAGPMSPSKAAMFHKSWTIPPCGSQEKKQKFIATTRGDSEKGLERIGRDIAHEMKVPWTEYWSFLGAFLDMSSQKGLDMLEMYLKKKQWHTLFNNAIDKYQDGIRSHSFSLDVSIGQLDISATYCDNPQLCDQTVPDSPNKVVSVKDENSQMQQEAFNSDRSVTDVLSPVSSLAESFANLSILSQSSKHSADGVQEIDTSNVNIEFSSMQHDFNTDLKEDPKLESDKARCDADDDMTNRNNRQRVYPSNDSLKRVFSLSLELEDTSFLDTSEVFYEINPNRVQLLLKIKNLKSQDSDDSIVDVVWVPHTDRVIDIVVIENVELVGIDSQKDGSIVNVVVLRKGQIQKEGHEVKAIITKELRLSKVTFLHGPKPTQEDQDVIRALGCTPIQFERYPNIFHWRINLLRFTKDPSFKWQSPAKMKSGMKHSVTSPQLYHTTTDLPVISYGSPAGRIISHPRIQTSPSMPEICTRLFPH
ncbi:hypothetical protein CHS0354_018656 [Potamilus streckersoni]|uniref:LEM domain-containing protein n=1 Tax=Potamilus streckersoni TaxID=2493646 RepID=A0AAE0VY64_9BIVA|nr:hypothetical protein CHS0354_018656 [Potamilus streckersoni]